LGKVVGVYMNKKEIQDLEALGKQLGIEGETGIIKTALKELSNRPQETAVSDMTVEIPPNVRLRAMIKEALKEVTEERNQQAREKAVRDARDQRDREDTERFLRAMGYED
jgi:hypothetical protein